MAIYEFVCPKCGLRVEVVSTNSEVVTCARCGAVMKRLFSTFTLRMK